MEEKLLDASMVPVEIMEKSLELLEILDVLADKGSRMAVSDVGVAVQFTRTALLGAVMNVYINTKSIKNREKAEEINQKAKRMIKIALPRQMRSTKKSWHSLYNLKGEN